MEEAGLVPDVLDKPPVQVLKVRFGEVEITQGNKVTIEEVCKEPIVDWESQEGRFYTLCFTGGHSFSFNTSKI